MNESDIVTVGAPLASIGAVQIVRPFVVSVTWAEGERAGGTDDVDLSPILSRYRVFRAVRLPEVFAAVRVVDGGQALSWGGDAEIAADTVERLARLADLGRLTAEGFREWMGRHGMTLDDAAAALGVARRLIAHYRKGDVVIPRTVALACAGYDTAVRDAA